MHSRTHSLTLVAPFASRLAVSLSRARETTLPLPKPIPSPLSSLLHLQRPAGKSPITARNSPSPFSAPLRSAPRRVEIESKSKVQIVRSSLLDLLTDRLGNRVRWQSREYRESTGVPRTYIRRDVQRVQLKLCQQFRRAAGLSAFLNSIRVLGLQRSGGAVLTK